MTNIAHIRGDNFALAVRLQRDNTNWSGSVVTCQLRTSTGQLVTNASGDGYVTNNSATANILSVAISIPNTVTQQWPSTVYGDIEVHCNAANIKPVTPVQFRITVSDDYTRP